MIEEGVHHAEFGVPGLGYFIEVVVPPGRDIFFIIVFLFVFEVGVGVLLGFPEVFVEDPSVSFPPVS